MQHNLRENKRGTMPVGKLLANMAVPMILSMLVQALYNVVDSIYISRYAESAVTALSLAFPVQNLMIAVSVGLGVGINAVLSRALGEKDQEKASVYTSVGFFSYTYVYLRIIGNKSVSVSQADRKIGYTLGHLVFNSKSPLILTSIYFFYFFVSGVILINTNIKGRSLIISLRSLAESNTYAHRHRKANENKQNDNSHLHQKTR